MIKHQKLPVPVSNRRAVMTLWAAIVAIVFSAVGCSPSLTMARAIVQPKQKRTLCWHPKEVKRGERFVFSSHGDRAISESNAADFDFEVRQGGLVFTFVRGAPATNLKLIPITRTDAWCEGIPKPPASLQHLFQVCPQAAAVDVAPPIVKAFLAQTSDPGLKSEFFCNQRPRFTPTTQEFISLLQRNTAYQAAYQQAEYIAKVLTYGEAEMQGILNKDDISLRNFLTMNWSTIEAVQERMARDIEAIEVPPAYDDTTLDGLAAAGFQRGFEDAKFKAEATLFAIDAGWVVLDIAVTEVILGPLGGAKLAASGLAKGSKALKAAMVRLGEIPIFLPVGVGTGAMVKIKTVIQPVSAWAHRSALRKAVEKLYGVGRGTGETTHHIVALNDRRAEQARVILKKFGIGIDDGVNGVFLPASTKSPNPKGALLHSKLHTDAYYKAVERALLKAKSKADAIKTLKRMRETLMDGTFHANF